MATVKLFNLLVDKIKKQIIEWLILSLKTYTLNITTPTATINTKIKIQTHDIKKLTKIQTSLTKASSTHDLETIAEAIVSLGSNKEMFYSQFNEEWFLQLTCGDELDLMDLVTAFRHLVEMTRWEVYEGCVEMFYVEATIGFYTIFQGIKGV